MSSDVTPDGAHQDLCQTPAMIDWNALSPLIWIAAAALTVGFLAARWLSRWVDRRRRVNRSRHAIQGEARARRLLERKGFIVEGTQVQHDYCYRCDGIELRAGLRADFIVVRGRNRYVAEVKTGQLVASLQHAPTRRQLLEYQHAFDSDGVLFIDAESDRIHRVEF